MTAKSRYDNLSSDRSQFLTEAEDGIRDRSPSRGLGDVYKRQVPQVPNPAEFTVPELPTQQGTDAVSYTHLTLPTSDLV